MEGRDWETAQTATFTKQQNQKWSLKQMCTRWKQENLPIMEIIYSDNKCKYDWFL